MVWVMKPENFLETAIGLKKLGMFNDAEAELLRIPPDADNYTSALHELLIVRLGLEDYDQAIETGRQLLERDQESRPAVCNTALALHFAGRFNEARSLMKRLPELGDGGPGEAYEMACLESKLGNFDDALGWLESALQRSESYPAKALIDSDLQPLWHSFDGRHLCLAQAHILLGPVFDNIRQWIGSRENDPELDGNDLNQLPEAWQRFFRFRSAAGTYSIHHLTAARYPEARDSCLTWNRTRIESSLQCIERAREHAANVVLHSQPAYAALHLAAGNFLGARYHVLWALGKDPALLGNFRENQHLRPLTYLFDELAALQHADCESSRLLIEASLPNPRLNIADLLDDIPLSLRDTSLYLLRAGQTLQNTDDHAGALAIWLKLCARWPQDSVGFVNGATCLMHLGLWDRAQTLLSHAPEAYRHFHLCEAQRRQLQAQNLEAGFTPRTRPFRGDPDLGGLLLSGVPSLKPIVSAANAPQPRLQ